MRSILALLLLTTSAAAAASDRAQVLAWARDFFADPYSLRSTEISDRAVVGGVEVVCVAFNGRNSAGAYVGIQRHPFEARGDTLVPAQRSRRVDDETCYQPGIRMRPFPELGRIQ